MSVVHTGHLLVHASLVKKSWMHEWQNRCLPLQSSSVGSTYRSCLKESYIRTHNTDVAAGAAAARGREFNTNRSADDRSSCGSKTSDNHIGQDTIRQSFWWSVHPPFREVRRTGQHVCAKQRLLKASVCWNRTGVTVACIEPRFLPEMFFEICVNSELNTTLRHLVQGVCSLVGDGSEGCVLQWRSSI